MTWLRRIFWIGTIAYWIVLVTATHLPPEDVHIPPAVGDKLIHLGAYFVLGLLLGISLSLSPHCRRWAPLIVIGVVMAYGAIDEWTQPLVNRSCELADWIADVTGASLAALLLFVAGRLTLLRTRTGAASLATPQLEQPS